MRSAKAEQCIEVYPEGVCARDNIAQIFVVSICTFVQVLVKQVNLQTRQYLYFFTSKASKIESTCSCVCARVRDIALQRAERAALVLQRLVLCPLTCV